MVDLENSKTKQIMSVGKWLTLLSATFVILFYGARFGEAFNKLETHELRIEKLEVSLDKGGRYTREDHNLYDSKVSARLTRIEEKLDRIFLMFIEKDHK